MTPTERAQREAAYNTWLEETMKTWWSEEQYQIMQIENEDTHVTYLCGREVGGSWEYAIVNWRYRVPTLLWWFQDGKILEATDA
jgi:hypothetical protein